MSRTEPFFLSGYGAWHPRVGCASQPGCYYRRVPTTSSARPTSTIVCTYIHRYTLHPSSPPSASLYLFISLYFASPRRFPSRASLPSTSRRAPCDPDCYTTLRPGSISTTTNPSSWRQALPAPPLRSYLCTHRPNCTPARAVSSSWFYLEFIPEWPSSYFRTGEHNWLAPIPWAL